MKKRTAKCGTESGYQRHYRLGETACQECLRAKRDSSRRRYIISRSKHALEKGINLPALTVARMYLLSPVDVQLELDRIIAPDVVDELVRLHDHYVDLNRNAS